MSLFAAERRHDRDTEQLDRSPPQQPSSNSTLTALHYYLSPTDSVAGAALWRRALAQFPPYNT